MRQLPFGKPILGAEEKQAVEAVMDSGLLVHGPKIQEFESAFADFTGAPRAVGTSSCTSAMHMAYFVFGLAPGDEVIVPAQTHVATAHAVELAGGTCVFVDSEADTGNIDIDLLEGAITPRTKAISVVHFLGMPVDMRRVMKIARTHNLVVIEDCALGVGSTLDGTHVGLFGDVGCFSFYPVKHITSAEGGMLITRNEALAEKISKVRAFGVDRHHGARKLPGMYDTVALGYNYRMSEIHAAIGAQQMKRVSGFLLARQQNYRLLESSLRNVPGVSLLSSSHDTFHSSYYCLSIILDAGIDRVAFMERMKERGVGTSIYYPRPVPLMTYYREKYGAADDQYPNASRISDRSVALPVGPHLSEGDMLYIAENVREELCKTTH